MTLRAVVKNGGIRLIDPLPIEVEEGQEVKVDIGEEERTLTTVEIADWLAECDRLASAIDPKDIDSVLLAIVEDRAAARAMMRREWKLR
jgi:hypothetical protein